jgi:hypothetical protein
LAADEDQNITESLFSSGRLQLANQQWWQDMGDPMHRGCHRADPSNAVDDMLRRRDARVDAGKAGSSQPLRMLYRLHETAGDTPHASPPRCCEFAVAV